MEAGKQQLGGVPTSTATTGEVKGLRRKAPDLEECAVDLTLERGVATNEVFPSQEARDYQDRRLNRHVRL